MIRLILRFLPPLELSCTQFQQEQINDQSMLLWLQGLASFLKPPVAVSSGVGIILDCQCRAGNVAIRQYFHSVWLCIIQSNPRESFCTSVLVRLGNI